MFVTLRTILANQSLFESNSEVIAWAKIVAVSAWELGAQAPYGIRHGLSGTLEGLLAPGEADASSHSQASELAISASDCVPILGFKAFLFASSVASLWD